jgi:hypothetical protein
MAHLSQADWDAHKAAIDEFHEDAFQQDVIWKKSVTVLSKNGEDNNERSIDTLLKGLVLYNYFRSWAINKSDHAGEIDKQSCMLYLNNQYLEDLGHINNTGQFKFKPVEDRFLINGILYKANGESQAAQTNNKPLLHFIILKREDISSSQTKY